MIRRLVWILAAVGIVWGLDRLLRRASASHRRAGADPTPPRPGSPRFEGALVRDRVCQTFLPRARALVLRDGGVEHFFCSESCRHDFLTRSKSAQP